MAIGNLLRFVEGSSLTPPKKNEYRQSIRGVPEDHLEGISRFYEDLDYLKSIDAEAVYLISTKEIVIDLELATPRSLIHEIGHHVQTTKVAGDLFRESDIIKDYQTIRDTPVSALVGMGLSSQARESHREFFAEGYTTWVLSNALGGRWSTQKQRYQKNFAKTSRILGELFGEGGKNILKEVTPKQDDFDSERRAQEELFQQELLGLLSEQEKRILQYPNKDRLYDDKAFWDRERELVGGAVLLFLLDIMDDTISQYGAYFTETTTIGIELTSVRSEAARWARRYSGELVRGITNTTRKNLRQNIGAWIESGSDRLKDLSKLLEPTFGDVRARMIAQTEVTRAWSEVRNKIWRESGIIKRKRWTTMLDELVCEFCGPMHGKVTEVGKPYPETDIYMPPYHPNCRCFEEPFLGDEFLVTSRQDRIIIDGDYIQLEEASISLDSEASI